MNQKTLKDIYKRLETLESANDSTQRNFSFINELFNIMKNIPLFNLLFRQAANKQTLHSVEQIVLPRRLQQLKSIEKTDIPTPIKQQMILTEKKLITKAKKTIIHRKFYDNLISQQIGHIIPTKPSTTGV